MNFSDKRKVLNQWILNNTLTLSDGDTITNTTCPFCNGGLNNDRSFSVTRVSTGFLYNCYRASCRAKGLHPCGASDYQGRKQRVFTPQEYKYDLAALTFAQKDWFVGKFALTGKELRSNGVLYNQTTNSFAWPIRDCRGYEIGILDRSYAGRKPKAIAHWFNDSPKLYFPSGMELNPEVCVLVEDNISAIKVSRHVNSVALLGSNISEEQAVHLAGIYSRLVIALDPDATINALEFAQKYNLYFKHGATSVSLSADPKNMSDVEIMEALLT